TMLLMDSAFNEANFGYTQFKNWLENNSDLLQLFNRDLQLYVAPKDFIIPSDLEDMHLWEKSNIENGQAGVSVQQIPLLEPVSARPSLRTQYKQIFNRLKMTAVDFSTRR